MKPKRSDYLIILASLVAIFLSGAAVGYVVGKKHSSRPAPTSHGDPGGSTTAGGWEARTLQRLRTELSLDDKQSDQISMEIGKTFLEIRGSKDKVLEEHYRHLLELHDRILPHLDETQKARLLRDRNQLERVMKERFENP